MDEPEDDFSQQFAALAEEHGMAPESAPAFLAGALPPRRANETDRTNFLFPKVISMDPIETKNAELKQDAATLAQARAVDAGADVSLAKAVQDKAASAAAVVSDVATLRAGKAEFKALVDSTYPEDAPPPAPGLPA